MPRPTINPMFIGMQYHTHDRIRRDSNGAFARAALTAEFGVPFEDRLTNMSGTASAQYELDIESEKLKSRAAEFHYEFAREYEETRRRRASIIDEMRSKMRAATLNQLASKTGGVTNWRHSRVVTHFYDYSYLMSKRAAYQRWAEELRKALAGDIEDFEAVNNALMRVRCKDDDRWTELKERIVNENLDVFECDDCGSIRHTDELRTDDQDRTFGECCEDNYRWSECMDCYISYSNCVDVYNSVREMRRGTASDYCTRYYANDYFYYSDRAGEWFTDEDERNEYDDGGEDSDGDGLMSYHCTNRGAFFEEVAADKTRPCLGVELEVYCRESRRDTVSSLKRSFRNELILERDGSLDDEQGFEAVTRPMGRKEWESFGPRLTSAMRELEVVGFNAPTDTGTYGIHVNLHRRWLSPLAEARIMMFLCAQENRSFVRAIAQRGEIYDPSIDIGQLEKRNQRLSQVGGVNGSEHRFQSSSGSSKYVPKICGVGKYAPVNWKESIAEFRIFASTLNTSSFMKNLEFVWALVEWTKPSAATGSTWDHRAFLAWLNTPANRKEYPNLVKYLSKKSFPLVDEGRVNSTWHELMCRPDAEAHTEGRAA